jgi:hypothetical protein
LLGDVDLGGNLREAMAKYNVTNLFDGMFAQTASKLMSKTQTLGTRAAKVRGTPGCCCAKTAAP